MEEARPMAVLENPMQHAGAKMIKCGSTTGGTASKVSLVSEENVKSD